MKRLTTLILTTLFALGMFLPVAVSLSSEGVTIGMQTASADADYTGPGQLTYSPNPAVPSGNEMVTLQPASGEIDPDAGTFKWTLNGTTLTTQGDGSGSLTHAQDYLFVNPATGISNFTVTYTPTDSTDGPVLTASVAINPAADTANANVRNQNPGCGFGILDNSSVGGCMESIVYYIPYSLGAWFLARSAEILDISATYTLSSKLFTSSQFITDGWHATRDIANMFFIFVLLYIAITLILDIGTGHANPKKMLVSVILVALLINFSMFFTEVIIDTSNTLALLFYNQISVVNKNGTPATDSDATAVGTNTGVNQKDVAAALAQAFEPQQFQTASFFANLPQDPGTHKPSVTTMIMLLVCIGAIFCVAAYSFLIAGLSFIGRLIQLMICVIFSPLAFISLVIPKLASQDGIGWESWSHSLMSAAFGAPIYFFFILLISKMAQSPLVVQATTGTASTDSITLLLTLLLSFIILVILLQQATIYAKKSAGKVGEAVTNFGMGALKMAGGFALGTATGGLAFVGQKTIGAVGDQVSKSETLRDKAINGNAFERRYAKFAINQGKNAATSSFDFGNTAAAKGIQKSTGMNFKVLPGLKGISPAANRGGYEARKKRKNDKAQKFADGLEHNKEEQERIENAIKEQKTKITAQEKVFRVAADKEADAKSKEKRSETDNAQASRTSDTAKTNYQSAQQALTAANQKNEKEGTKDASGNTIKSLEVTQAETALQAAKTDLEAAELAREASKTRLDDARRKSDTTTGEARTEREKVEGLKKNLTDLEKRSEGNKKGRMHAAMYQYKTKSGHTVKGAKKDEFGNMIDSGYIDTRSAARRWRAVLDEARKGAVSGTAAGVAAGAILPGVGSIAVGATAGVAGLFSGLVLGFQKELVASKISEKASAASAASSTSATAAPVPASGGAPTPFVQPAQLNHQSTFKGVNFTKTPTTPKTSRRAPATTT